MNDDVWRRLPPDAPSAAPTPLDADDIVEIRVPPNGGVPNNPRLAALLYPGALAADHDVERVKALFERNRWFRVWDWTVFDYHHFHPASHEALAVVAGRAEIRLGGEGGPLRSVRAGDVMILPAGFGHCRVAASGGFTVVGAYPAGQEDYEVVRAGEAAAAAARSSIAGTPLPSTDPVYGADGPLRSRWAEREDRSAGARSRP